MRRNCLDVALLFCVLFGLLFLMRGELPAQQCDTQCRNRNNVIKLGQNGWCYAYVTPSCYYCSTQCNFAFLCVNNAKADGAACNDQNTKNMVDNLNFCAAACLAQVGTVFSEATGRPAGNPGPSNLNVFSCGAKAGGG